MSGERLSSPGIAAMPSPCALPRKSGELVFHDEWERRAFAIAVSLAEGSHFEWHDFQKQLTEAISEAERNDPQHPTRGYYESWLVSLEALLSRKRLAD